MKIVIVEKHRNMGHFFFKWLNEWYFHGSSISPHLPLYIWARLLPA